MSYANYSWVQAQSNANRRRMAEGAFINFALLLQHIAHRNCRVSIPGFGAFVERLAIDAVETI